MDGDIIVVADGDERVKVIRPVPGEPIGITHTKLFLLACLHRQAMDKTFMDEMGEWLNNMDRDTFLEKVKPQKGH
jgi:hypothetical protein